MGTHWNRLTEATVGTNITPVITDGKYPCSGMFLHNKMDHVPKAHLFEIYETYDTLTHFKTPSQQIHIAGTSLQRRCKVVTLQQRNDVVVMLCVCWVNPSPAEPGYTLPLQIV